MSNNILFVFEGERAEKLISNSLNKYFVNEQTNVQFAFCGEIYQLYTKLCEDEFLDTFEILKQRPQYGIELEKFSRDDFAEIYLFFDYDGHAQNASDDSIKDLLKFFNEETEYGKLYLSYPMVEAIRHIPKESNDFKVLKTSAKVKINYKKKVGLDGDSKFQNVSSYSNKIWNFIIEIHLKKVNFIVNDEYKIPTILISQLEIFEKQLEKYISIDNTVAVVSGFPIFVMDYYGVDTITRLITE